MNISAIFPDTNADESLPSSYHFVATDSLMKSAKSVGAKIIFRLGENVQNIGSATAKNTPPADFDQWARVAERIIAHYEDGWSNGYHYQDIMWEVWNEPTNNGSWSGSLTDYALFYKTVYRFIKKRHPNIDISPAYISDPKKRIKLYQYLKENNLGISHCFAHYYASNFSSINDLTKNWKKELDEFGFDADVLINEWNYLSEEDGWYNLIPTYYAIQNPKAAVWYAKQMIYMQAAEHLAGAVYYTSDMPGFWTGLYKQDSKGRYVKLPTYDVFKYFGKLYELGTEIRPSNVPNGILTLAASNGEEIGIIVVNDTDKLRKISINIGNLTSTKKNIVIKGIKYHTLNENIEVLLSPYDVSFISIY